MKNYFLFNIFIVLIIFIIQNAIFSGALYAINKNDTIIKTEFIFGDSIDIRLIITATSKNEFTENDLALLNEFITLSFMDRVGVIECSEKNLDIVIQQLKNFSPNFNFEVRYYHKVPWILTTKAAKNLPKLNNNSRRCAQIVVTIEPVEGDIRVVCIKDNKSYVTNVAGVEEDIDNVNDEDQIYVNTAKRELSEELEFYDIRDDQLFHIGQYSVTIKKSLLGGIEWQDSVRVFSCHLNVAETTKWLEAINVEKINDNAILSYKFFNDEVEWLFVLKPEIFAHVDIMLSIDEHRMVKITRQDADMAAVVLKGKFGRNVLVGRGVNYLNGIIECNKIAVNFIS